MKTPATVVIALAAALLAAASAYLLLVGLPRAEAPTTHNAVSEMPFATAPESARLLFVGDMLFDRTIRTYAEREGIDHILSCVADLFAGYDLVVGNLEGPITPEPSVSQYSEIGSPDNFRFTMMPETGDALYRANLRLVNLGNNHILNYGYEGAKETAEYLKAADVAYIGDPATEAEYRTELQGVKFAFVSHNEFGGDRDATLTKIAAARADGYLPIVYTHWGTEYEPIAEQRYRDLAHDFVDAGAVAVIGSHPHVVQDDEIYKGAPIYYSLGNFVFDQYWDETVSVGLAVELSIDRDGAVIAREFPARMLRDRRTCIDVQ